MPKIEKHAPMGPTAFYTMFKLNDGDAAAYTLSPEEHPTGAVFSIWQPGDHRGTTVTSESGTLCWADLSTSDPDRAKQFYEGLFGWKIGPEQQYPQDYLVIKKGETPIGLPESASPSALDAVFSGGGRHGLTVKAKELGGAVHLAPVSMGGVRLSVLADPQGAAFSIIQPSSG
jgi:predicted enzyme related to lactoylglutathione lyase